MTNTEKITRDDLKTLISTGAVTKLDVRFTSAYEQIYVEDTDFFDNCFKEFLRRLAAAGISAYIKGHLALKIYSFSDPNEHRAVNFMKDMVRNLEDTDIRPSVYNCLEHCLPIQEYNNQQVLVLGDDDCLRMTAEDLLRALIPLDMLNPRLPSNYKIVRIILIAGKHSGLEALERITYNEYSDVVEISKFMELLRNITDSTTIDDFVDKAFRTYLGYTTGLMNRFLAKESRSPVAGQNIPDFDFNFDENLEFIIHTPDEDEGKDDDDNQ